MFRAVWRKLVKSFQSMTFYDIFLHALGVQGNGYGAPTYTRSSSRAATRANTVTFTAISATENQ